VQRALQVLGRALASTHPAGLASIVAGATATDPRLYGLPIVVLVVVVRIPPNSLGRSFSSFTFRVLICFIAISAIATLMDEKGGQQGIGYDTKGQTHSTG
jgi:hypothetical protein